VASADTAYSKGNYDEALEFAIQIVDREPANFVGQSILGRCYLAKRQPEIAVEHLGQAVLLEPNLPILYHLLGQSLAQLGRLSESEQAFLQAIRMAPNIVESFVSLGQVYIEMDNRSAAATCFRNAYHIQPNTPRGLIQLAKALTEESDPNGAEAVLRKAISIDPKSASLHVLYGQVLQQLGRFDDAAAALERAISLQPTAARPYLHLVKCRRMTEKDRPLLSRMSAILAEPRLSMDERRYLEYALGKSLDDLGEYEHAIRHFDNANRMMLRLARLPFDREAHTSHIDRTIEGQNGESIRAFRESGEPSDVPIFIVGMIRSGTTLVEQIVSSHPDVGSGGELKFWRDHAREVFEPTGASIDPTKLRGVANSYLEVLRSHGPNAQRVTDKMPLNFMVLGAIHATFPNARIIHCRRNPLDNALSMYLTPFAQPVNFVHSRENIAYYYREYQRLMAHWRDALPVDRFLEIDYEEVISDRERVTHGLIEFLGLKWDDACLYPESNDRAVSTPSMWQVRQPVYRASIGRWRNYEPWLGELRGLVPT